MWLGVWCVAMPSDSADLSVLVEEAHARHFGRNIRLTLMLLAVWAIAGLGCGVLFADALDAFELLGFPLGFWFAQQGAIIVFVVLILVYALAMRRIDKLLEVELDALARASKQEADA